MRRLKRDNQYVDLVERVLGGVHVSWSEEQENAGAAHCGGHPLRLVWVSHASPAGRDTTEFDGWSADADRK